MGCPPSRQPVTVTVEARDHHAFALDAASSEAGAAVAGSRASASSASGGGGRRRPSEGAAAAAGSATRPRGTPASWPREATLLFVRHAQALASKERAGVDVRNPRLSTLGEEQARRLAAHLRSRPGFQGLEIVCSPMRRCLFTAAPFLDPSLVLPPGAPAAAARSACAGRRTVCLATICEHGNAPSDFSAAAIAEEFPAFFGASSGDHEVAFSGFAGAPGAAEGAAEVTETRARAEAAAAWLLRDCAERVWSCPVAVVSHQTFLDCLLQILLDGDASAWEYGCPKYRFQNTGVYEVAVGPRGARLVRQNDTQHLS
eukprot:TRINITY_DN24016_c0_g1_i1.p1 TRINITY_DN24016_c0_g1~~TRINITY_DN24016_c0_g1_i1.p1  ORF type:complete len:332 (+),score=77.83 TRINITY_DN24016_c0_g1_i1:53-997(+)